MSQELFIAALVMVEGHIFRLDRKVTRMENKRLKADGGKPRGIAKRVFAFVKRIASLISISFDYNDMDKDTDGRVGFLSTYPEVHATGWGLGLGLAAGLSVAFGQAAMLTTFAACVRTIVYAHTGREVTIQGKSIELPARYLKQIRREPQYLDGAMFLAFIVGVAWVYLQGLTPF